FLAKVAKVVAVRAQGEEAATAKAKPAPPQQGTAAAIAPGEETPDLTLWLIEGADPTRPDEAQILIQSPHLQPVAGAHRVAPDLGKRLDEQYAQFARKVNRGAQAIVGPEPPAGTPETPSHGPDRNILMLKGFGAELYANAAPLLFKQALATLQAQLGPKLRTVQIYTNSPRLPWELLAVPKPGTNESEFLGTQYRVARWHITSATNVLTRPTQRLSVRGVYLVAPKYDASRDLPAQEREIQSIVAAGSERVRRVGGTLAEVRSLVAGTVATEVGVVHFAGHGQASAQASDKPADFAIRLADGDLPLLQWKGLAGRWGGAHPLVFFNACEVGRAERAAGFVDGWGPAVLETGASGYIGGLWPLGDTAAADAAQVFYRAVLAGGAVPVAEAVRQVRARFAETGDPTYLAYVFYGDAALTVQGPANEPVGGALRVAFGPPHVTGGLSVEVVRRLLQRTLNAFRYCAEVERQRRPNLAGRAVLQFVVDPKGTVVTSSVQGSTLGAPNVEQCWATRVRTLQFPAPEGGGIVMVSIPIVLAP
ncbi:MAG: CHAT domain-containing protein, partial [Deltaproteobacteria bacterium]|nr:CHAT domain-containing protein [Deltaproteobacteria bacterium]